MPYKSGFTNRRYLEALERKVLIFDGAMGTNLQALMLTPSDFGGEKTFGCNDYLSVCNPRVVEQIHRSFLDVGVDVIETNTFRANRLTLGEYGLQDMVIEINHKAALLARRLADEISTPDQPRFVAGSIGPSGKLPSADDAELSNLQFDALADVFKEQATGLIQGAVDLIIIETSQDMLEVRAAIHGTRQAFSDLKERIPLQVQVTLDTNGRMLMGTDIQAVLAILDGLGVDVIGLNCSTGPEHMRDPIRYLGEYAPMPVSCIPNAGLPVNVNGEAVYILEPELFAIQMTEFVERFHISVVGGCCGTTPEHLNALVRRLRGKPSPVRPKKGLPHLSSAISAIQMRQDPPPFLIGERCNATGSRVFKRLLIAEDLDGILQVARAQVSSGAHALDVSVAMTESTDEVSLMARVVKKLALGVDLPLVIDSTELDVMEQALKTAPGRCLINSTHLESGKLKLGKVLDLARKYNAVVLFLTIDEKGMAKTLERKLEVAERIYKIATEEFGLRAENVVFDLLTFPLSTGDVEFVDSAIHTIEGIRKVKATFPGVFTSLGISNVSFGLTPAARPVLNSAMLYHCVQAGLDMAIVNPAQIKPMAEIPKQERILMEDLIFNRRSDSLQRVIEFYENMGGTASTSKEISDPFIGKSAEQRIQWRIIHRHADGIAADIDHMISQSDNPSKHASAVIMLNQVLLPAMKEVGDKFGAGELILPFVLQSAEVMKKAVTHLETYLDRMEGTSKGKVVLATVYGDVHDIGKNLVKTILVNNGFEVIDLGKQVPAERIIQAAVDAEADAIGLSALLVSTSKQMPLIVGELHRRGLNIPVLIGGAAINRRFGWRISALDGNDLFKPGVFYCKDAFEGLEIMNGLVDPEKHPQVMEKYLREVTFEMSRETPQKADVSPMKRSKVTTAIRIPEVPRWGYQVMDKMPLAKVFDYLATNELFRLSWGAKNAKGEQWETLLKEFEERLSRMKKEALSDGWLQPQGIYGYWPAQSEGNSLILYHPEEPEGRREKLRFEFPRQSSGEHLCLSDYFAPVHSNQIDVVALQVVTVGSQATSRFDSLQGMNDYSEAYYNHGLAVQTAEAAAEYLHRVIRKEIGLDYDQGKRYSWGYPAIPDLEDHKKVFELLPAEEELGMSLTSAYQLVPEQSTAAILVHHPDAKYFSTGASRLDQLTRLG